MGKETCMMVNVVKDQAEPELKQGDCVVVESTIDIEPGAVFCHLWHRQAKFKRLAEGIKLDGYNVMGKATSRIIDVVGADESLGTPQGLQV